MNVIEFDFENAIDNIANTPMVSTVRLNGEEIKKAHKSLKDERFWGYIDEKGNEVRSLVTKLLNNEI
jgi:hypothetical protein